MSKRDPDRRGKGDHRAREVTKLTGRGGRGPVGEAGRRPYGTKLGSAGFGRGNPDPPTQAPPPTRPKA